MFIIILLLIIVAFIVLSAQGSSAKTKGKQGEKRVIAHADRHLNEADYTVLNNCTFQVSEQLTTQIDHTVVSRFGIFVVETKNYQGWILVMKAEDVDTKILSKKLSVPKSITSKLSTYQNSTVHVI